jgi:hypothetical protein
MGLHIDARKEGGGANEKRRKKCKKFVHWLIN